MKAVSGIVFAVFLLLLPLISSAAERLSEITVQANLKASADAKDVRIWLPYPISDRNQDVSEVHVNGNYSRMGIYSDAKYGNTMLYAEWKEPAQERMLTYTFVARTKERVQRSFPANELPYSPTEMNEYLTPSGPEETNAKVQNLAATITKGQKSVLAKARSVYDWIVDNMHRDPKVKGCGLGEVDKLLVSLGGKCTDIHSVFVALARASGVPAREVFGIRLPKGKEGDMTKFQHCWAEFYLPGYGWVVVDPADVRKIILEQNLTLEQAAPSREYYFGAVDENRVAFGTGRNIVLNPKQSGVPLNYFMYPYAEADGKPLNEDLYGFNLGYTITFKQR
jgi:transglutaminase-like putative cysteine protease